MPALGQRCLRARTVLLRAGATCLRARCSAPSPPRALGPSPKTLCGAGSDWDPPSRAPRSNSPAGLGLRGGEATCSVMGRC